MGNNKKERKNHDKKTTQCNLNRKWKKENDFLRDTKTSQIMKENV